MSENITINVHNYFFHGTAFNQVEGELIHALWHATHKEYRTSFGGPGTKSTPESSSSSSSSIPGKKSIAKAIPPPIKKTFSKKVNVNRIEGAISGTAHMQDNLSNACADILDKLDAYVDLANVDDLDELQEPFVINLAGWSRGAVTAIGVANVLQKLLLDEEFIRNSKYEDWSKLNFSKDNLKKLININIFAADPVPGPGHSQQEFPHFYNINENVIVTSYQAYIASKEKRAFMAPLNIKFSEAQEADINFGLTAVATNHSGVVKKSSAFDIVKDDALSFFEKNAQGTFSREDYNHNNKKNINDKKINDYLKEIAKGDLLAIKMDVEEKAKKKEKSKFTEFKKLPFEITKFKPELITNNNPREDYITYVKKQQAINARENPSFSKDNGKISGSSSDSESYYSTLSESSNSNLTQSDTETASNSSFGKNSLDDGTSSEEETQSNIAEVSEDEENQLNNPDNNSTVIRGNSDSDISSEKEMQKQTSYSDACDNSIVEISEDEKDQLNAFVDPNSNDQNKRCYIDKSLLYATLVSVPSAATVATIASVTALAVTAAVISGPMGWLALAACATAGVTLGAMTGIGTYVAFGLFGGRSKNNSNEHSLGASLKPDNNQNNVTPVKPN